MSWGETVAPERLPRRMSLDVSFQDAIVIGGGPGGIAELSLLGFAPPTVGAASAASGRDRCATAARPRAAERPRGRFVAFW